MEILQIEPAQARGKLKESMWNSSQYVGEIKYDGSRALMHCGIGGNRFTSRHISKKTNLFTEKTENFPHLKNIFVDNNLDGDFSGTIFDGELVFGSNSMDVTKITGALPSRAIEFQRQNGWLNYVIFDVLMNKGQDIRDKPWSYRRAVLEGYFEDLDLNHVSITEIVKGDKKSLYEEVLESGGEGIILKDTTAPYGKKTGWVKAKRSATWDVVVTNFKDAKEMTTKVDGTESISKFAELGWVGAVEFGQYFSGKLISFGYCSGMSDALREDMSNNKEKYIGTVIEITAQERIPKTGRFRHPRIKNLRPDKKATDCIYNPNES